MTLRPGEVPGRAIAVFPFLKTTDAIQLGSFSFRSTDDTSDLEKDNAANVREIADMLFLKDDLRVRSASYAMLPPLDLASDRLSDGRLMFGHDLTLEAVRANVPVSVRRSLDRQAAR